MLAAIKLLKNGVLTLRHRNTLFVPLRKEANQVNRFVLKCDNVPRAKL